MYVSNPLLYSYSVGLFVSNTVEHIYDACPKYSEFGNFHIITYLYVGTVATADSASTVKKKYSVFIYSEAEPHAMYAIYKQTLTLCVLQYPTCLGIRTAVPVRTDDSS